MTTTVVLYWMEHTEVKRTDSPMECGEPQNEENGATP